MAEKQRQALCPRLIDYLAIVGSRSSNITRPGTGQSPAVQVRFIWIPNHSIRLSELICNRRKIDSGIVAPLSAIRSCRFPHATGHGLLLSTGRMCECWAASYRQRNTWGIVVRVHPNRQRLGQNPLWHLCEFLSTRRTICAQWECQ